MAKKRCLMIGAGGMAGAWIRRFFPAFGERMEIMGLVDVREEALNSSGDFLELPANRRFGAMEEAFRSVEADFCTIVIPPAVHKNAVLLAVERGLPILSEKPIADTWEACVEIYRAVTGAGLQMEVVQNYRYEPRILTLKRALEGGDLGRVNYLISRFADDYRQRGAWGAFRHEIRHSLLVEGSVHHFDQLRNLAGSDCQSIAGWEWNPGHASFDGECCGMFVARMANGVVGQYEGNCLEAGTTNSWYGEYYRVECENGAAAVDRDGTVRTYRHTRGQGLRVDELPRVRAPFEAHQWIINEFLDWLDGGPQPATVLQDNIKSAAMLFSAIDASATGQTIDVEAKARSAEG